MFILTLPPFTSESKSQPRSFLQKLLNTNAEIVSPIGSMVGETVHVQEEMIPGDCKQVRCHGTWYTAICAEGESFQPGDKGVVDRVDRIKLVIKRWR